MCSAAGNAAPFLIVGSDAHQGDVLLDGQRLSLRLFRSFTIVITKVPDYYGKVLIDRLVGQKFSLLHHIPCELVHLCVAFQSQVDGHIVITHVEATVGQAIFPMEDPREQMLTGVTLHVVESSLPVKIHPASGTDGNIVCSVKQIVDLSVVLIYFKDLILLTVFGRGASHIIEKGEGSPVGGLTSAFREEHRLFQNDGLLA